MKPEIIETQHLAKDALSLVLRSAHDAVATRGEFRIALSGGNTPKPLYEAMAGVSLPWDQMLVTFGDERCVPPDNPESNYHMVKEALFDRSPLTDEHILRMKGEMDPDAAAHEYAKELHERSPYEIFRHDLLLLGMGPDGHTASLFPGTPVLDETSRLVAPNYVEEKKMWRVTFTYPLINAARHVCFVVSRKGKEKVLDEVLAGSKEYPCAHVEPTNGKLTWLIGE